jgi:SAM-dependent methyltransferase
MSTDQRTAKYFTGGALLLDLGCGDGKWLDEIGPRYRLAVGIDIVANSWGPSGGTAAGWRPVLSNLDVGIPLASDIADAVHANQLIEHVRNPLKLIHEVYRVLRVGGVFVVTTPNVRYLKHAFRLIVRGQGPMTSTARLRTRDTWDDGHLHYFTPSDLAWMAKTAQFRDAHTAGLIAASGRLSLIRRSLNRAADHGLVREFLSGNTTMVAVK